MTSNLKGKENIAKLLIENGAVLNAKRSDGWTTPLHQAIFAGMQWNIRKLIHWNTLKWDANWNEGHYNVVKMLIENNADMNVKDTFGRTLLHYTVANGTITDHFSLDVF